MSSQPPSPPSNFDILENEFQDIILTISEGDGSGRSSSYRVQRKTIRFHDGTHMTVTEHLKDGNIDYYQYDWCIGIKRICGFHSEPHEDKSYQTPTEPHHIHSPNYLSNVVRFPNWKHTDLFSLLETIRIHQMANNARERNAKYNQ